MLWARLVKPETLDVEGQTIYFSRALGATESGGPEDLLDQVFAPAAPELRRDSVLEVINPNHERTT